MLDQALGELVHEVEVVAREVEVLVVRAEVEPQPLHRADDGVDVLLLLLLRVGVVEAHVADAAVLLRQAEVQADRLRVPDVEVAVGLRGEARADPRGVEGRVLVRVELAGLAAPSALGVLGALQVGVDALLDEVGDVGAFRRLRIVGHGVSRRLLRCGNRLFWPISRRPSFRVARWVIKGVESRPERRPLDRRITVVIYDMAIAHSKLTSQGQISVPAQVRRKLGLGPGSVIEWVEEGGQVVVRHAGRYSSEEIHRALFPEGPPKAVPARGHEGEHRQAHPQAACGRSILTSL